MQILRKVKHINDVGGSVQQHFQSTYREKKALTSSWVAAFGHCTESVPQVDFLVLKQRQQSVFNHCYLPIFHHLLGLLWDHYEIL